MLKKQSLKKANYDIVTDYSDTLLLNGNVTFAQYIRQKRKELNEESGQAISTRSLAESVGIGYEVFRKILNQQRPTNYRDCIIAICVALHMLPGEIDVALNLYQYMPSLDDNNPRDVFISSEISNDTTITINKLNDRLINNGFPRLKIHNSRSSFHGSNASISKRSTRYKVLELRVRTPIEEYYQPIDIYESLATEYDPLRYNSRGEMLLKDLETGHYIELISDKNGPVSEQTFDSFGSYVDPPIFYKRFEDTADFKCYFLDLSIAVKKEVRRLLTALNDTKNYKRRSSARLINESICVFCEEYNYSVPEFNEYYILTYSKGLYRLQIYKQSVFMHYYLSEDDYKKYYDDIVPEPIESYDSLKDVESLSCSFEGKSDNVVLHEIRKNAFKRLKPEVDSLYNALKKGSRFIQNLDVIFDNPAETLSYYNVKEAFHCAYNEYGDICNHDDSAEFTIENNTRITITFDDIQEAFKLGFDRIEDICQIKQKYGSVRAVLE